MANINIAQHFETQQLSQMELSSYASVAIGTSIRDTVAAMASGGNSCAFVMSGSCIAGIFTERDVASKVVRQPEVWDAPIEDVMTPDPYTVSAEQTAMDALRLMNHRRFRNVPVRSDDGELLGNLTHYDLIRLASAFLGEKAPVGAEFVPEHSLLFVNFTGLMVSKPVTFEPTASLAEVIHAMTYEETGLVSIVDGRGAIIGEFTEHDIFTKVACRIEDSLEAAELRSEVATLLLVSPVGVPPGGGRGTGGFRRREGGGPPGGAPGGCRSGTSASSPVSGQQPSRADGRGGRGPARGHHAPLFHGWVHRQPRDRGWTAVPGTGQNAT